MEHTKISQSIALAIIAHEIHLHDLQHDLAISDDSHALHAIHAGSREHQTETFVGFHFGHTELYSDVS